MIENSSPFNLLENFKNTAILCIGDVLLDRFISGEVNRISPEAPIPILKITKETSMLGGAGNVVQNLVALGAKVRFLSVIGDDTAGQEVLEKINHSKTIKANLILDKKRQTSIKIRFLSGNQQILRSDKETTNDISENHAKTILNLVQKEIRDFGALVLSDYGKGVLTDELLHQLITTAKTARVPVIVDPKGKNYSCYQGSTLITPNKRELEKATGIKSNSDESVATAAAYLIKTCKINSVLATRSSEGMTLQTKTETKHFVAEAREVYDVSGAGDTVVAVMACAISSRANLNDAVSLANTAAGIVVGKFGTAVIPIKELAASYRDKTKLDTKTKIMTSSQILKTIKSWRSQKLRIGFTNGCFDILHLGHLSLLDQSKKVCDRLVIGVNTDKSVKRLKGEKRPLNPEEARIQILAAMSDVDAIILFDEDTPINLIKRFKPDVLIKGADYTINTVIGADFVIKNGGEIFLAQLKKGFSSSKTINRIKNINKN